MRHSAPAPTEMAVRPVMFSRHRAAAPSRPVYLLRKDCIFSSPTISHHRYHQVYRHCSRSNAAGLCNGTVSVGLSVRPSACLSLCPSYRQLRQRAAGLLLSARRAGYNESSKMHSLGAMRQTDRRMDISFVVLDIKTLQLCRCGRRCWSSVLC